jgi:hypothetical protein
MVNHAIFGNKYVWRAGKARKATMSGSQKDRRLKKQYADALMSSYSPESFLISFIQTTSSSSKTLLQYYRLARSR